MAALDVLAFPFRVHPAPAATWRGLPELTGGRRLTGGGGRFQLNPRQNWYDLMAHPLRVLVFHEDQDSLESLQRDLVAEGFEVTTARSFIDAVPFIVGKCMDLLLIYLPNIEWVRRAVLYEIRRANISLPVVAVATTMSDGLTEQLGRLRVSGAFAAPVEWTVLVQALREAAGGASGPVE